MIFEVKRDGRMIMQTRQETCIPDRELRKQLRSAGYSLYIDGKTFAEKRRVENTEEQMDGQMSLI